jgi:hypothetical protein
MPYSVSIKLNGVYMFRLGKNYEKYLCTNINSLSATLLKVRESKSKIDSIRLPESIEISFCGEVNKIN